MGINIDLLKCTGCGICTYLCPTGALNIEGTKCYVQEGCTSCGACVDACSFRAITLEGSKTGKGLTKKHGNKHRPQKMR